MNVSLEKARAEYNNNNNDRNDIADAMENQISLLVVYSVFLLLLLPADSKDFWDAALLPIVAVAKCTAILPLLYIDWKEKKGQEEHIWRTEGS